MSISLCINHSDMTPYNRIEEPCHVSVAPPRPSFPIERQIVIDASPVVLVNVFMLDKADEQNFLKFGRTMRSS